MIDIHSHILYGVDDGAKTINDSIRLIDEMVKQGVTKFILTPHRRKGMFEETVEKIEEHFKILKEAVKNRYKDIELYLGREIYYNEDVVEKIGTGELYSLANSRYVLIEFNYGIHPKDLENAIYNIVTSGKIPVIAHIERYECLEKNIKLIEKLIEHGVKIQVNAESVLKPKLFGDKHKKYKQRAKYFLEKDIVDIISSDAHNLDTRKPYMKEAYDVILKKYGEEKAKLLFELNAENILRDED